jgi:hypothetical protein
VNQPKVPPYHNSHCHRCAAHRYVKGRATVFVMCTALPVKYPPQPVVQCEAFRPESRR